MARKTGGTNGRPRKELTDKEWKQIIGMVRIQCTQEEICSVIGMCSDTLGARIKDRGESSFSELYKKHSGEGKTSLRRMQYKAADEGSVPMLIWLGKQWLGQSDKVRNLEQPVEEETVITRRIVDPKKDNG